MLNRNFAIALAVAMVLAVLYGCSSSGGIKDDRDMYKEDAEMLQGSLDTANEEVTRLTGELATATMMAGDNAAEVTQLEGELATATMMAGDNAAEVTRLEGELATATMMAGDNAAEVTRLEGELATATMMAGDNAAEVTRLEGELATATMMAGDNAAEVTRLEGELATAETDRDNNLDEVTRLTGELATATNNAGELQTMLTAVKAELEAIMDAADLETISHQTGIEAAIMAADRPMVTQPTVDGISTDVEITDLKEIDMATEARADIDGFDNTVLRGTSGEDDETTTTAFVYDNRKDPGDEEFTDYYVTSAANDRPGFTSVDSDGVLSLSIAADQVAMAAAMGLYDASGFPSGDRQDFDYISDSGATDDVDEDNREFAGRFHGVPGTYNCTSNACAAMSDMDGNLESLTGSWTFTPDDLEGDADPYMVLGVTPKLDYVFFGVWVEKTTMDEKSSYEVNGIFGGGEEYTSGAIATVEGNATYNGTATGKYMSKTFTPYGEVATAQAGQFTAAVTLMADFGGPEVAEASQWQIEGAVTNFMDGDQNIGNEWEVTLAETAINQSDSTFSGETMGGGDTGSYNGGFFGRDAEDTMATPASAAGQFDAHFKDGHVLGGFGAAAAD